MRDHRDGKNLFNNKRTIPNGFANKYKNPPYTPNEALQLLKELGGARIDKMIDLALTWENIRKRRLEIQKQKRLEMQNVARFFDKKIDAAADDMDGYVDAARSLAETKLEYFMLVHALKASGQIEGNVGPKPEYLGKYLATTPKAIEDVLESREKSKQLNTSKEHNNNNNYKEDHENADKMQEQEM